MSITLYVVHGSHPCVAVARALELKRLEYRTVELLPPLHAPIQRVVTGTRTVPSMRLDTGEKVSGSMAIMRRLEELAPAPSLFPADPDERVAVERAEQWGDEVWQPIARRLLWVALARSPRSMPSYQDGARWRLPALAVRAIGPVAVAAERRMNNAREPAARADLRSLPRHLDRIDRWLSDGVLDGDAPNAADLQIATSSRLMLTIEDLTGHFAGRPAETHARTLFPTWPGVTPAGAFPGAWLTG